VYKCICAYVYTHRVLSICIYMTIYSHTHMSRVLYVVTQICICLPIYSHTHMSRILYIVTHTHILNTGIGYMYVYDYM